jgi:hypothetical protein
MALFLTTSAAVARIEEVIDTAHRQLVLLTPYVKLTHSLDRRLRGADERGVQISLVCRFASLAPAEADFLADLENLHLFDDPHLHAKCFLNERGMVLTSLNLYAASHTNNEMGVWLDARHDAEAFDAAMMEARSICQNAQEVKKRSRAAVGIMNGIGMVSDTISSLGRLATSIAGTGAGSCIRCGTDIPFDPARPYCYECFRVWTRYENPHYQEVGCHSCGRSGRGITMAKPLCTPCFNGAER